MRKGLPRPGTNHKYVRKQVDRTVAKVLKEQEKVRTRNPIGNVAERQTYTGDVERLLVRATNAVEHVRGATRGKLRNQGGIPYQTAGNAAKRSTFTKERQNSEDKKTSEKTRKSQGEYKANIQAPVHNIDEMLTRFEAVPGHSRNVVPTKSHKHALPEANSQAGNGAALVVRAKTGIGAPLKLVPGGDVGDDLGVGFGDNRVGSFLLSKAKRPYISSLLQPSHSIKK